MRLGVLSLLLAGLCCPQAAFAVSPRALLEVVDFGAPVLSPDGKRVAFRLEQASVERNTYDAFWYVQDIDGDAPPRRVADGGFVRRDTAGIALLAPAVWSPDGRWLYYLALIDGRLDVWRAAADGAGAIPLTLDAADVRGFELADDGRTLRYRVGATREAIENAEQAEYNAGVRVDSSTPVGQTLFRSGNLEGRLATQRYGDVWFARVPLLADVPDRWKEVDLQTLERRDFLDHRAEDGPQQKQDSDAWILARSPVDGRVAVLTRVGERGDLRYAPDVMLSARLSDAVRDEVVCRDTACTGQAITSVQWRPGSDEVLFTVTDPAEGLAQSLFAWNVRSGAVRRVAESTGLLNGGRDPASNCAASYAALVCVSASANEPPWLERVDLETGARRVLYAPNAALAQAIARQPPARLLRWTDAKGQTFTGQFYPADRRVDGKPPLFVNYYRCPGFLRGGVGDEWPFASLASEGISALCINAAPFSLDPVSRFNTGLSAVESAVDLLASMGEIDRNRVGMGGLSFGTEITMWTAMHSQLLTSASVSSVLVSPLYYLLGSLRDRVFIDGLQQYWGLGAPDETPEAWRTLSPVYQLDKLTIPLLMQVPEQEYMQSLDYAIPLMRRGTADLYVFPHEPHQKFQPRHKLAVYTRNMEWFRFWLQGVEDTDPAKVDQYAAWRAMRDRTGASAR
ncbi:Atxe2 family lasso peptide isopeptidase [Luteimonas sp. TWI1416]|uniref:Atxe2 family lasso peptide isopeptidase n=1 Tax=unclassified Luteimonas TaxID=2629088 RepID=UPI00320995CE